MLFQNRRLAGERLAWRIIESGVSGPEALVLALPRGGVPVAAPIARALGAELDVFVVRKLGVPGREEYAMGAIASGGIRVLNTDIVRKLRIDAATIEQVTSREREQLERRERKFRGTRPPVHITEKTVILVDDGLATGASMRVAIEALRMRKPAQLIVAVPVAPAEALAELAAVADRVECLETPEPFRGVGLWYGDFSQTTDDEVVDLLAASALREAA